MQLLVSDPEAAKHSREYLEPDKTGGIRDTEN
jgi:hypothetical protein